ncbi:MAG TPA: substrate-binding domain-containing protein [Solirubrobacteraceae bacterium]|nr:substrate-binding domain-containing protein [Solirubrobacteraceae bacterium]
MSLLRNSKVGIVSCALAASVGVAALSGTADAKVSGHAASISINSFTNSFSGMSVLKPIVAEGKGKIAAIMPDTTSSTRYEEFDQPDIKKALLAAGMPASDIITPQNAQKSDTTFMTDVEADISNGATVILIDPEDPGTGVKAQKYAKAHGAKIVQYDRLSSGAGAVDSDPYVSFNNVTVGKLIGQGFVSCEKSWLKGSQAQFIEMHGAPTDNNATLFTEGYDSVLKPLEKSGKIKLLQNTPGTWNPTTPKPDALDEFEAAYQATGQKANSAVIPNDENGAPIINWLKTQGVKPDTFPMTGQDATLVGLQNIISGYQCGTVYKPIYKEAGAAVALAIYLRAGKKAPAGLENSTTTDPSSKKQVPSVLETPEWVTGKTMNATVIKDGFVKAKQLCSGSYKSDCTKYGIK